MHAATRQDAAAVGFDDEEFYRQLRAPQVTAMLVERDLHPARLAPFAAWRVNDRRAPC